MLLLKSYGKYLAFFVLMTLIISIPFLVLGDVRDTTKIVGAKSKYGSAVSEALLSDAGKGYVEGEDFELSDIQSFENGEWVVLNIQSSGSSNFAVLQNIDGFYEVVMGPGTVFSKSYVYTIPIDVFDYLYRKGLIND